MWDDVAGEEVKQLGGVLPAVKIGLELTEVSGADAIAGGLNLDPDDTVAEVEGDVEGLGVSPWLEDRVTVAKRFGYELGFHPFAAFLEALNLGMLLLELLRNRGSAAKEKARPMGRASFF